MCGIIGEVRRAGRVDPKRFDRLRDRLAHRGPDGAGTKLFEGGSLALGHRRLSILDLSEAGAQPMPNEDETVWITFNGEIYNFARLKQELQQKGHRFRSHSDTEVLVHGYEEWGLAGLLQRVKGMFAFGLYDAKKRQLHLARDRFGIKPLVFFCDERRCIFSSEIKSLVRDTDVPRRVTQEALADYFIYSYVPTPRSIYAGVEKLEPATYLTLELDGWRTTRTTYWSPERAERPVTAEEAAEEVEHLLAASVREHLVSDVPVGVFLSGGYDSSSVLLHGREAGAGLSAFSLGFADSERSEHHAAATIADRLGADHHVRLLEPDADFSATIERLAAHYDEPYGVTSMLTYHEVSELAAASHKVVLAGDGGDEVLAGYSWYARLLQLRFSARTYARALLGRTTLRHEFLREYDRSMTGPFKYLGHRPIFTPEFEGLMRERAFDDFDRHLVGSHRGLKNLQWLDLRTFMLDNCLYRGDMSSMLHSLEVRIPFLDHKLIEFIFSVGPQAYYNVDHPKMLLRRALERKIPSSVLDRPKQGFGFQHRNTLLQPRYEELVNNGELMKLGLLRGPVDFGKLNAEIAFHLVFLEGWLSAHRD